MVVFTERHHAFISASYYRFLREAGYEGYRDTFKLAVRLYGEQRGARMAKRALRDRFELDFASYRHYSEWKFTEEYLSSIHGKSNIEIKSEGKDYTYHVTACPWADVYREAGLEKDGGPDYCSVIDSAIARGFNPDLEYVLGRTLHDCDFCSHTQKNAKLGKDDVFKAVKTSDMRGFDYHCGHLFKTFSEVMRDVYLTDGEIITEKVIHEFANTYGEEAAKRLNELRSDDYLHI